MHGTPGDDFVLLATTDDGGMGTPPPSSPKPPPLTAPAAEETPLPPKLTPSVADSDASLGPGRRNANSWRGLIESWVSTKEIQIWVNIAIQVFIAVALVLLIAAAAVSMVRSVCLVAMASVNWAQRAVRACMPRGTREGHARSLGARPSPTRSRLPPRP